MVLSSVAVIALSLGSQSPLPPGRLESARATIAAIRSAWMTDRPDIDAHLFKSESLIKLDDSQTFWLSLAQVDAGVFWRSTGKLSRYDVAAKRMKVEPGTPSLSQSKIEQKAVRFAIAAGHPAHPEIFQVPAPGIVYLRQTWRGIPFARESGWIGLDPGTGYLKYIRFAVRESFASSPDGWDPSRSTGAQIAVSDAATVMAQHGAFDVAEIVSAELSYFYRDPQRLQKIALQAQNLANPSVPIDRAFVIGLVPGLNYNPPTSVCYQVHFRIPVNPERNLGTYSNWWMYVDAMTGEPINVEFWPEQKYFYKANMPTKALSELPSISAKLAWKGRLIAIRPTNSESKLDGKGTICAVIDGKRVYAAQFDEAKGIVSILGKTFEVVVP